VITNNPPSMGADDFTDYSKCGSGLQDRVWGEGGRPKKVTPLHTSTFDIDERAFLIGARLLCEVLLESLNQSRRKNENLFGLIDGACVAERVG
jgi:metal-dependent amidase/aminoacylase/carboxypeptidase family protein